MKGAKQILLPLVAGVGTFALTSLVMSLVFASQPTGLHDFGACLGILFWLGVPIVVVVETVRGLGRSKETDAEQESGHSDFAGCTLLVGLAVAIWMLIVSWTEGWSRGPLHFAGVIVIVPGLWLVISVLATKQREGQRRRKQALEREQRRKEVEYRNTHCPKCNASDYKSQTSSSTYETTEVVTDHEDRYNRDDEYTGRSEHHRTVPVTKTRYSTWHTCNRCGEVWWPTSA
jgi:transcription elongation factor Elf1